MCRNKDSSPSGLREVQTTLIGIITPAAFELGSFDCGQQYDSISKDYAKIIEPACRYDDFRLGLSSIVRGSIIDSDVSMERLRTSQGP